MAVNSIISKISDLNEPLYQEELPNILVSGDQNGDRFDITVVRGSEKVNVASAGVTGYFIRIKSGTKIEDAPTVVIIGSASDNILSVTLPESCYVDSGRFSLVIKAAIGNERHAVYACSGVILRSSTNEIIDPGHEIPDLDELLAMISQVESAASAAQAAAQQATGAAGSANTAAEAANSAAAEANRAKGEADTAAANANAAAGTANASAAAADEATGQANAAANAANTAAGAATTATGQANEAAANANAKADYIGNSTFTAHNVEPGGAATVTKTDKDGHAHFDFGLVKGTPGDGDVSSVWGALPDDTGDAKPAVGGVNLLTGTKDFSGSEWNLSNATNTSQTYNGLRVFYKPDAWNGINYTASRSIEPGSYTLSFYAKANYENDGLYEFSSIIENAEKAGYYLSTRYSSAAKWERLSVVFNMPAASNTINITISGTTQYSRKGSIYVCGLKLERGVVPTDWTPAPEDLVIRSQLTSLVEAILRNHGLIS